MIYDLPRIKIAPKIKKSASKKLRRKLSLSIWNSDLPTPWIKIYRIATIQASLLCFFRQSKATLMQPIFWLRQFASGLFARVLSVYLRVKRVQVPPSALFSVPQILCKWVFLTHFFSCNQKAITFSQLTYPLF